MYTQFIYKTRKALLLILLFYLWAGAEWIATEPLLDRNADSLLREGQTQIFKEE